MKNIRDHVYGFKTKHRQGFVHSEIESILKEYPSINMDKFYNALMGNTCMIIDGEMITYHCDIEKALVCGVENRNLTIMEWD